MNNIFAILNQNIKQKNICTFLSLCDNNMCFGHNLWSFCTTKSKNICKNCHSFLCDDCIMTNREKCVMCTDGDVNYCKVCKMKARKFMCCKCGDNIYINCCCDGGINRIYGYNGIICNFCSDKNWMRNKKLELIDDDF